MSCMFIRSIIKLKYILHVKYHNLFAHKLHTTHTTIDLDLCTQAVCYIMNWYNIYNADVNYELYIVHIQLTLTFSMQSTSARLH